MTDKFVYIINNRGFFSISSSFLPFLSGVGFHVYFYSTILRSQCQNAQAYVIVFFLLKKNSFVHSYSLFLKGREGGGGKGEAWGGWKWL